MPTFERTDLQVAELVSGHSLSVPVFRYRGSGDAPSVYIQANMHGAELQGNAVIYAVMRMLEHVDIFGDITLVPHANPIGVNQKVGEFTNGRFDPVTGRNWNRLYWQATCQNEASRGDAFQLDVEAFAKENLTEANADLVPLYRKRLREALDKYRWEGAPWGRMRGQSLCIALQAMAFEADLVLDLHTASRAVRYAYVPEYAVAPALYFKMPYHIWIPNQFGGALDEAVACPWWDLAEAMHRLGRRDWQPPVEAFTLEFGHQETSDLEAALADAESLCNYLRHKGVIDGAVSEPTKTRGAYLRDVGPLFSPAGGLVHFEVAPGEPFFKGQLLATILTLNNLQPKGSWEDALTQVRAPANGVILSHCSSGGVVRGMELCQIMAEPRDPAEILPGATPTPG